MPTRFRLYVPLGIAAIALTRILFRSRLLYDLDSVNFALGMLRFDPAAHQPHPPGYFLYVCLARLVNQVVPDPNAALVAVSIAASCGAAWIIACLAREWFGAPAASLSVLLFLVSPLGWFHGIVALTYMVEAFFSALIGYWCWRVCKGETAWLLPASIAFALAAGFRPSTGLMLAPLWLFTIWRVRGLQMILAVVTVGLVTLAWFLPMTAAAGGFHAYFDAFAHLWGTVAGRRTTLASPWLAVARIFTIAWIFVLCFGSASLFAFWPKAPGPSKQAPRAVFVWVWVAPGLLFFSFVFLNYVNSGYLLVLSPPAFAYLAVQCSRFLAVPERLPLRWAAVAAGVTANCALFFLAPIYCSYRSVREFEAALSPIAADFSRYLDPQHTLIVGFDAHFQGYRHAGYYLPAFVTVQYPEVGYPEGKRVFFMQDRNTRVVRQFPAGRLSQFVLFPLPGGSEYTSYLQGVEAKLPAGTLRELTVGGTKTLTGPVSALPALFPATMPR